MVKNYDHLECGGDTENTWDSTENTWDRVVQQQISGKTHGTGSWSNDQQIYLEAQSTDKPVGEPLRREGLFSTDLARIRQQVMEGALVRLSAKPGRKAGMVPPAECEALKQELLEKERALADRAVELTLLRKKPMGFRRGDSRSKHPSGTLGLEFKEWAQ